MAGLTYWTLDLDPNNDHLVLLPDGTPYQVFGGDLEPENNSINADSQTLLGTTAGIQSITSLSTLGTTGTYVVYNRTIDMDTGGALQIANTNGIHVFFVNCTITFNGAAVPFRFQGGNGGGSAAPGAPAWSDTVGNSRSWNALGCTFVFTDATGARMAMQFGQVEDSVFINSRASVTSPGTAGGRVSIYGQNGGTHRNNRYDNSRAQGATLLYWQDGAPIVTGPTFIGAAPYLNLESAGSKAIPTVSDVENYANPAPVVWAADQYAAIARASSTGISGFNFINPEDWETIPYTGVNAGTNLISATTAANVPGRAIGYEVTVPQASGDGDNYRVAISSRVNPLYYDDSTQLTDTARQGAGVPNMFIRMTRPATFGFNFTGNSAVNLTTALTTDTSTDYTTGATGLIESIAGEFNPNGGTNNLQAGTTRPIESGDGLVIPYLEYRRPPAGNAARNAVQGASRADVRVFRTTFDIRSFTHRFGDEDDQIRSYTISGEPTAENMLTTNIGQNIDRTGVFIARDANLSDSAYGLGISEITTNFTSASGVLSSSLWSRVTDRSGISFTGFNPDNVAAVESAATTHPIWTRTDGTTVWYIWFRTATTSTAFPGNGGWHVSQTTADGNPWAFATTAAANRGLFPTHDSQATPAATEWSTANGNAPQTGVTAGTVVSRSETRRGVTGNLMQAYFETRFAQDDPCTSQDIYDLMKWLHASNADNANAGLPLPTTSTSTGGANVLSGAFNITLDNSAADAYSWAGSTLTLRCNGINASAVGDPIQGIALTGTAPLGVLDAATFTLSNLLRGSTTTRGALDVSVRQFNNLPVAATRDAFNGGTYAGIINLPADSSLAVSGDVNIEGVSSANTLTISGVIAVEPSAANAANIEISRSFVLSGFADTGILTIWEVDTSRATSLNPAITSTNHDNTTGVITAGTTEITVAGLTSTSVVRLLYTDVNSLDISRIVDLSTLTGDVILTPTPTTLPSFVGEAADFLTTSSIVPQAFDTTNNLLPLNVTALFSPAIGPAETNLLLHNGIKRNREYHSLLNSFGNADVANTRINTTRNYFNNLGPESGAEMDPAAFRLQSSDATDNQGLGYILPTNVADPSAVSLSTPNLESSSVVGVLVYPSTEFDLPVTVSSLNTTIQNNAAFTTDSEIINAFNRLRDLVGD